MVINEIDDSRNTLDRRTKILDLLDANGLVRVNELANLFQVSDVTIRNDLAQMENKGFLIRTRGGGIKSRRTGIDFKLTEKAKQHSAEKQAIGKKAAEMIKDGDTIIIDSGTTTLELAKNLNSFENLIVITNALNIASQLVNYEKIKIIMLGGVVRQNSLSLIGPTAENNVKNYFCDKLFIGVDGIDSRYGITTPNTEEAHLNKMMIEISKEVILLADSSKFLRRSFAFIAPVSKIKTVITDKNIPTEELTNLQNQGVKVIFA